MILHSTEREREREGVREGGREREREKEIEGESRYITYVNGSMLSLIDVVGRESCGEGVGGMTHILLREVVNSGAFNSLAPLLCRAV